MTYVSIVTGTYNRMGYLSRMVQSVRESIGVGIPYEIVVVDGGSTDGSLKWCKLQHDIVLIEQKKLLGAVKAFNAGAYKASGEYVILANDDIILLDHTIPHAISYMQDNPNVGVGCFYQDRYNRNWHVEQMPAVVNGKQASVCYGQVCIIPKWLGDKVGWWGNYLHTYGGDNELSCNILELGYKVEPIDCTAIHDLTPDDELRKINNAPSDTHPDTSKWLEKWSRGGFVGPTVVVGQNIGNVERELRIFYAPIYEPGYPMQKVTKRGLRDALCDIGLVYEFDYVGEDLSRLYDVACAHDADIFIFQLQDSDIISADIIKGLRAQHPEAVFVNWNGDYHPDNLFSDRYILLMEQFDLVGVVTTEVANVYDEANINWFYWQIGYEKTYPSDGFRGHDIVFLANGYSKDRLMLARSLIKCGYNVGLYGSWSSEFKSYGNTLYDFDAGAAIYKNSKIAIGDSQWIHATGFVSNRLFQALEAGAFLLHQRFDGMEELLGLKSGEHLVVWDNVSELLDIIPYWMNNKSGREKIAKKGQKFVIENHSFDVRVNELMDKLGYEIDA